MTPAVKTAMQALRQAAYEALATESDPLDHKAFTMMLELGEMVKRQEGQAARQRPAAPAQPQEP